MNPEFSICPTQFNSTKKVMKNTPHQFLMNGLGLHRFLAAFVMLLAFLVMLVKLGSLVEFQFGPAVVAFVLCVGMSMVASISFDPHAIWEEER